MAEAEVAAGEDRPPAPVTSRGAEEAVDATGAEGMAEAEVAAGEAPPPAPVTLRGAVDATGAEGMAKAEVATAAAEAEGAPAADETGGADAGGEKGGEAEPPLRTRPTSEKSKRPRSAGPSVDMATTGVDMATIDVDMATTGVHMATTGVDMVTKGVDRKGPLVTKGGAKGPRSAGPPRRQRARPSTSAPSAESAATPADGAARPAVARRRPPPAESTANPASRRRLLQEAGEAGEGGSSEGGDESGEQGSEGGSGGGGFCDPEQRYRAEERPESAICRKLCDAPMRDSVAVCDDDKLGKVAHHCKRGTPETQPSWLPWPVGAAVHTSGLLAYLYPICLDIDRSSRVVGWAVGLFLALSVDGFQHPVDCSTAFLGMFYTRCWVALRRGYKRCVGAVAGGPRFGSLERISCDLVVGCLRRLD
eukprot:1193366-Prorocentrum_minimum.AAC.1